MKKILFLILTVSLAGTIYGQSQHKKFSILLSVGIASPLTYENYSELDLIGDEPIGTRGPCVGGQFLYHPFSYLAVGLEGNLAFFGENKYSLFFVEPPNVKDKITVRTLLAVAKIFILDTAIVKPYLSMGIGYAHIKRETKGDSVFEFEESSSGLSNMIGAGVDIDITDDVFIGTALKWYHASFDQDKMSFLLIPLDEFSYYDISFNIGIRLGRK